MRHITQAIVISLTAVLIGSVVLPATVNAGEFKPDRGQAGADPSEFVTDDGRFNLEAARRAGFEGAIDLSGSELRVDPNTGEPVFSSRSVESDPDDVYWSNEFYMSGLDWVVRCAIVYNGDLVVGGDFDYADGILVNHIARWNGSYWSAVGDGVSSTVYSLAVHGSNLAAGGSFNEAGGVPASRVASWNGTTWSALGDGLNGHVYELVEYGGKLIAADTRPIDWY